MVRPISPTAVHTAQLEVTSAQKRSDSDDDRVISLILLDRIPTERTHRERLQSERKERASFSIYQSQAEWPG